MGQSIISVTPYNIIRTIKIPVWRTNKYCHNENTSPMYNAIKIYAIKNSLDSQHTSCARLRRTEQQRRQMQKPFITVTPIWPHNASVL
jgi:hypothetical protein